MCDKFEITQHNSLKSDNENESLNPFEMASVGKSQVKVENGSSETSSAHNEHRVSLEDPIRNPASKSTQLHSPSSKALTKRMEIPDSLKEILAPTPTEEINQKQGDDLEPAEPSTLVFANLPARLTDSQFLDLFVQFGKVKTAKIVRSKDGESKRYGYATFSNNDGALVAIKHYNEFNMWGSIIKVAFLWKRDDSAKHILKISSIPLDWKINDVRSVFGAYGEIYEIRETSVSRKKGRSIRKMKLTYKNSCNAQPALLALNGWVPKGFKYALKVNHCVSSPGPVDTSPMKKRQEEQQDEPTEVYSMPHDLFGGFYSPPRSFPDEVPESSRAQAVKRAPGKSHQSSNTSSQPSPCPSPKVNLTPAQERIQKPPVETRETILFIYNLPRFLEAPHVRNFCRNYGPIKSTVMQQDNNGDSLGMAYVTFSNPDVAESAHHKLNGSMMFRKSITTKVVHLNQ